jgi:hypothetical protein
VLAPGVGVKEREEGEEAEEGEGELVSGLSSAVVVTLGEEARSSRLE